MGDELPDEAMAGRRERIDIYFHFPDGIPVQLTGAVELAVDALTVNLVTPTPPRPTATRAILIIIDSHGGTNMPGQITVDTTNEQALFAWLDDKGDTDAAAPTNASGAATPTFASDNDAAAAIDPASGAITPTGEGQANISVTVAYPDGSAVLEADGVTAFPTPDPVVVTVTAGGAVGDTLSLSV